MPLRRSDAWQCTPIHCHELHNIPLYLLRETNPSPSPSPSPSNSALSYGLPCKFKAVREPFTREDCFLQSGKIVLSVQYRVEEQAECEQEGGFQKPDIFDSLPYAAKRILRKAQSNKDFLKDGASIPGNMVSDLSSKASPLPKPARMKFARTMSDQLPMVGQTLKALSFLKGTCAGMFRRRVVIGKG